MLIKQAKINLFHLRKILNMNYNQSNDMKLAVQGDA